MEITVANKPLKGRISVPSSKSDAHRAIVCAALADKPTRIMLNGYNSDIDVTLRCIELLGATVAKSEYSVDITPITHTCTGIPLNCGESGSTLRFLLPVAAALGSDSRFEGRGRLPERPIGPMLAQLAENGVSFSSDRLPLSLSGKLTPGVFTLPGNISSQFVSGLLMALPLLDKKSEIVLRTPLESAAYVDMTISTLAEFIVNIIRSDDGFIIHAPQNFLTRGHYQVQGDWSSAAFWHVANALGGKIEISGLDSDSAQPDAAIAHLAHDLPDELDVSAFPDLFPVLAVCACGKQGDTRLFGAARLRIKESDRIAETARFIAALGGAVEEMPDALLIHGTGGLRGGSADSAGDHRIAMAAAIAAAICQTPVTVRRAEAVDKSYPAFWAELEQLSNY